MFTSVTLSSQHFPHLVPFWINIFTPKTPLATRHFGLSRLCLLTSSKQPLPSVVIPFASKLVSWISNLKPFSTATHCLQATIPHLLVSDMLANYNPASSTTAFLWSSCVLHTSLNTFLNFSLITRSQPWGGSSTPRPSHAFPYPKDSTRDLFPIFQAFLLLLCTYFLLYQHSLGPLTFPPRPIPFLQSFISHAQTRTLQKRSYFVSLIYLCTFLPPAIPTLSPDATHNFPFIPHH